MNRLRHNWNLKLISLGLAVLLWLHVRGEVNPTETAEIDVPLKTVAACWMDVSQRQQTAAARDRYRQRAASYAA